MGISKEVLDPASVQECVEEMFALLEQEKGLKPANPEIVTHNRLGDVFGYTDHQPNNPKIGNVHVDVQLSREKDRELAHRVELAGQVRQVVQEELVEHSFPGNSGGELTLYVRVLVVSDGSSGASRRYNSGVGDAKVTLAYCLLPGDASHGIILANTVYHKQDCRQLDLDNYWELSNAVVRSLAGKAAQHILSQITFHLQQWKSHSKENQKRIDTIQAKLANEENLSMDEYVFASEKHML